MLFRSPTVGIYLHNIIKFIIRTSKVNVCAFCRFIEVFPMMNSNFASFISYILTSDTVFRRVFNICVQEQSWLPHIYDRANAFTRTIPTCGSCSSFNMLLHTLIGTTLLLDFNKYPNRIYRPFLGRSHWIYYCIFSQQRQVKYHLAHYQPCLLSYFFGYITGRVNMCYIS